MGCMQIEGGHNAQLALAVNAVARVQKTESIHGSVIKILTAAGTITLDDTSILPTARRSHGCCATVQGHVPLLFYLQFDCNTHAGYAHLASQATCTLSLSCLCYPYVHLQWHGMPAARVIQCNAHTKRLPQLYDGCRAVRTCVVMHSLLLPCSWLSYARSATIAEA